MSTTTKKTHHEYRVERLAGARVLGPSFAKVRGKETTRHARCATPVRFPGSPLPMPCGDRVVKAGRCAEHYADWKHAKETRRGTQARNPKRAGKKTANLSSRQWVKRRKEARRVQRSA